MRKEQQVEVSHLDCVYRLPDSVELFAAGEQIGAHTLVVRQQLVQFESDKSVLFFKIKKVRRDSLIKPVLTNQWIFTLI
jgi:hypothetical protein